MHTVRGLERDGPRPAVYIFALVGVLPILWVRWLVFATRGDLSDHRPGAADSW
jgi:hypothetical protein